MDKTLKSKLELLFRAAEYDITKLDDGLYSVKCIKHDLAAIISRNKVEYFVTGVYNHGDDYKEIDIEALKELLEFCNNLLS